MKQLSLSIVLLAFMLVAIGQPADAFARGGDDDDDRVEYRDDHDDEDESDEDELEVEADVFTDITIVKVELPDGKKYTFSTDADTEAEVVDVVADKFDLTESAVAAALEFEMEDRASRANERGKTNGRIKNKDKKNNRFQLCHVDGSHELEVEADVFTDITIVKVELASGTKKVFETDATTTNAIADAVADRFDLDIDDVKDVLDIEVEDRASRASDRAVAFNPADCDDDRAVIGNDKNSSTSSDAALRAQVVELERLLEKLIRLFTERFGSL